MRILLFFMLAYLFLPVLQGQIVTKLALYPKGRLIYVGDKNLGRGVSEVVYFITPGVIIEKGKNSIVGKFSYSNGWSRFEKIPIRKSFHLSYRRYVLEKILKSNRSNKVKFFLELESVLQDWEYKQGYVNVIGDFEVFNFAPFAGIYFDLRKNIGLEIGYGYRIFPKRNNKLDLNFGITYNLY